MIKFLSLVLLFSANANATSLQEFLIKFEGELNNRNTSFISNTVDFDAILNAAFRPVETSEDFQQQFSLGFKEKAQKQIGANLMRNVPEGARVKLIKSQIQPEQAQGTYRFDYGDNGFGYIRFIFQKLDGNNIKITDWFDYASGQKYSSSISTIIRGIAPAPGILGRLKDIGSGKKRNENQMIKYSKLVNTRDYAGLQKMFEQADDSFKKNWVFMSGLLFASNLSGNETFYKDVLNSISENFGHDKRAGFMLIDHYYYQQEFEKALSSIERLSEAFDNNDAGMLLLKANTLMELKKYKKSYKVAEKCIQVESDFEDCYWSMVTGSVIEKDFASTVKHLKSLESVFGYQFDRSSFEGEEFYNEFVKSDEYSHWLN